jgi:hypothetical protein|tara:strand:+ start:2881 stop:3915 length:1035 start_codon:yes stop_codon:yes gene_type:complete
MRANPKYYHDNLDLVNDVAKELGVKFFKEFMTSYKNMENESVSYNCGDLISFLLGQSVRQEDSGFTPIKSKSLLSIRSTSLILEAAIQDRDEVIQQRRRIEYKQKQFKDGHINQMLGETPNIKDRQAQRTRKGLEDLFRYSSLKTPQNGAIRVDSLKLVPSNQWDDVKAESRSWESCDTLDQILELTLPFDFLNKIVKNDLNNFRDRFVLDIREKKSIGGEWVQAKCLWLQASVGFTYKVVQGMIAYHEVLKWDGPFSTAAQPRKLIQRLNKDVALTLKNGRPSESYIPNREDFAKIAIDRLGDDLSYIDYFNVDIAVCQSDKFRFEVALASATKHLIQDKEVA